ncbi:hypothetical protein KCP69_25745 [Salmonella enterica subsp. enterica]|nr:hypothetical protein KCP69_25745 [Salmonella enterica subsp. enterica]
MVRDWVVRSNTGLALSIVYTRSYSSRTIAGLSTRCRGCRQRCASATLVLRRGGGNYRFLKACVVEHRTFSFSAAKPSVAVCSGVPSRPYDASAHDHLHVRRTVWRIAHRRAAERGIRRAASLRVAFRCANALQNSGGQPLLPSTSQHLRVRSRGLDGDHRQRLGRACIERFWRKSCGISCQCHYGDAHHLIVIESAHARRGVDIGFPARAGDKTRKHY